VVAQICLSMVRMTPVLTGVIALMLLVLAFTLGLVALIRCETKDVPEVVRELAKWWRRRK
jgi:hypothetical protein